MERLQYQVAAFDPAGKVLKTDSHFVELLLPGQRLGVGGDMFVPDGRFADRVEVQLLSGKFVEAAPAQPFAISELLFVPDALFPTVTGLVRNPYSSAITKVRVNALTYNAAGTITGGGFTYLDFVPAGGQTGVVVRVTATGNPHKVELHAAITILSERR